MAASAFLCGFLSLGLTDISGKCKTLSEICSASQQFGQKFG